MSNVIYVAFGSNYTKAMALYVRADDLDENPENYAQAIKLYQQSIKIRPDFALAWVNLGNVYFRQGHKAKAERHYRTAIGFEYHLPAAHYNLGYLLLEGGKLSESIESLRTAIEQDPRFADAHYNLAQAYTQAGQPHKARPHWRTYVNLEPDGYWVDHARRQLKAEGG